MSLREHAWLREVNQPGVDKALVRRVASLIRPEELKQIRERMGLSQRQLASRLGVARATVWRWEAGVHPVEPLSARLIEILAAAAAREGGR